MLWTPAPTRLIGLCALATTAAPAAAGDFIDHGAGAAVAELRSLVPTVTEDGWTLLIGSPTDFGPTGYLRITDVDTGETTQHFRPEDVRQSDPFGAQDNAGRESTGYAGARRSPLLWPQAGWLDCARQTSSPSACSAPASKPSSAAFTPMRPARG